MRRIKVGIIGQGRSGRNIHRHLFECMPALRERYEVIAIADPIVERHSLDGITPSPELKCYTDYKQLLADKRIELVVNASRSHKHIDISIEALEAGFNVICEKPLARKVADVERLEEVIKKTGKFFAVFQQSRFRPLFRKSLEVMNSGVLGRIVMVKVAYNCFGRRWDWQTIQDMCAGELLNTGPHPLDQVVQFFGDADPEQIFCKMDRANTFGDAEDHIKLIISGKGHPTIDVEVSRCCAFPGNTYEIYGTCGGLKAVGAEVSWKYFRPQDMGEQKAIIEPLRGEGAMPVYCSEDMHLYEEKWTCPAFANSFDCWGTDYYKDIYEAFTTGRPTEVKLEQVKRQIRIIEECHRQNPFPKTIDIGDTI